MSKSHKKIYQIYESGSNHWVGDGFPVRNFFPSNDIDKQISPFLLLDYAGPYLFPPTSQPHGVGEHPHRGFETVTILYQGRLQHRDSAGNHGIIGSGDVQWMTAASGVVHEEMHETQFAAQGGMVEMVQLWVNLPKKNKMSAPHYQTLLKDNIPVVALENNAGYLRVIAGEYQKTTGIADTFTRINLYDVLLTQKKSFQLTLPEQTHTGIFLMHGVIEINGSEIQASRFVLFENAGEIIDISATQDAHFLVLNGEPLDEPIVRQGPFVMNTEEELRQAYFDYRSGKMGKLE